METDMTQMIVGHEGLSASGFRKRMRQRSLFGRHHLDLVWWGDKRVSMGSVLLAYPYDWNNTDTGRMWYILPGRWWIRSYWGVLCWVWWWPWFIQLQNWSALYWWYCSKFSARNDWYSQCDCSPKLYNINGNYENDFVLVKLKQRVNATITPVKMDQ